MALGDMYYAIAKGTISGIEWINRYWYHEDNPDASIFGPGAVTQHLKTEIYTRLAPIFADDWFLNEISTYLWRNPQGNTFTDAVPLQGAVSATDASPSFLSATFRSPKGDPGERYGFKRFAGLTEALVNGNSLVSTSNFTEVETFLGAVITAGLMELSPALVLTVAIPPLGLGVNPLPSRFLDGNWDSSLGTQNSRKS